MRNSLFAAAVLFAIATLSGVPDRNASGNPSPLSNPIRVADEQCELTVTAVTPRTLRITLTSLGKPLEPDDVLVDREWPRPALQTAELDEEHTLSLERLRVTIRPSPLSIVINTLEREAVQRLRIDEASAAIGFSLGQGRLFGLGSGNRQFDRRGGFYPMECLGANHLKDRGWIDGHRLPIPLLVSTDGWGLFVHRPYASFDLRGESGVCAPKPDGKGLPLDIFVTSAEEPPELMDEYTRLTGRPSLPPRWALGYFQSHRTLAGPHEVFSVARTFRRKQLPCDGLIYLGAGFCPRGWNLGHNSFQFDPESFPDPEGMIDRLHDWNFKVVLHTTMPPPDLRGNIPPEPNEKIDSSHIASYWSKHEPIVEMGVDGWWPDTGQSLPVKAKMARLRMYYRGQLEERPDIRPFQVYENTGYSGMQRYGGWTRTGDTTASWETLREQVPNVINASLSGVPYTGTCPGGFNPTPELTGEMYARWFQFNAFTPFFQSHGRTWHTRLPWGWNTGELGPKEGKGREPKVSALRNPAIEPVCRKYLELRYQLIPYLYTLSREAHDTGLPIIRAMWLHYADDPAATRLGSQYLWGRDILVAPVTEQDAGHRDLYLPRGAWYDFWSNDRIAGGREITRPVDLETLPLYIRAGAILPFDPVRQYTGQAVAEPTTIRIYEGADGEFILYEDDGGSQDYTRNKGAAWTRFHWDDRAKRLSIDPDQRSTARPASRRYRLLLLPAGSKRSVEYRGRPLITSFGE